jgi:PAS domain S-box-containing protein
MLNIVKLPKQIESLFENAQNAIMNVSERKQAEKELRESQRYLSDIVGFLPDATMVIDHEGKVVAWNRAMEEFTGVKAKAMLGKGDYEYALPFYGERRPILINLVTKPDAEFERSYVRTERCGNTLIGEGYMQNMRGEEIFLHGTAAPLHNSRGEIVGAIESIRNITERKRAEEELEFKNLILATQQEVSIDGILVVDERGAMISHNRRFVDMWGITPEVVASKSDELALQSVLDKLIDPESFLARVKHLYAHKKEKSREEIALSDGRIFDRYSAPMSGADGKYYGRVWYFRDITEQKRAEERRLRLEARLLEMQKLESLIILAGGVAHDFNNLLTAIIGYTQLALLQAPPGSTSVTYLAKVEEAAKRAAQLADQMLAFSGKGRFHVERIELSQLVKSFSPLLATVVSKPIELRYLLTADLPLIKADLGQLGQVIIALVTNAVEAIGGSDGVITLRTGVMTANRPFLDGTVMGEKLTEGTYVFLDVADTGGGIATDILMKIFDPFFSTKFVGRGLGLAAVHGIMRGHHGTIMVESRPGEGTTFRILFPCTPILERKPRALGLERGQTENVSI